MGKFSSFLRKSSDKDKTDKNPSPSSSNPYLQQQDPPQYDGNQYHTQNSQPYPGAEAGSRVGLPSSVRPGGLPNKLSYDGVGRNAAYESDKTSPPPAYNHDSHQLPGYASQRGTSGLASGYQKDKLGASDGFGRDRFGSPALPQSNQHPPRPTQNQGGYGGLGDENGALFANYSGPQKFAAAQNPPQPGAQAGGQGRPMNWNEMTDQEKEDYQVQETKTQIVDTIRDTKASGARSVAMVNQFVNGTMSINEQLMRDRERLHQAHRNLIGTGTEVDKGRVNLSHLDAARAPLLNLMANSSSRIAAREEKKTVRQLQHEKELAQLDQDEFESTEKFARMQAMMEQEMRARDAQEKQAQQKTLLGGKPKNTWMEFEDDTGEQAALNEEIEQQTAEISRGLGAAKMMLQFQQEQLSQQNDKLKVMSELADKAQHGVSRNQLHLNAKHGR
ncbi:hypothetical protein MFIFM68171_01192 [Madurella fahalii]|uniref:t-SNARE coiled-coil homology domain-containing protein n=1 Tax=Madurella fahalii TaxID=1157608 RepID=A0ABQ0FZR1_9PEZI